MSKRSSPDGESSQEDGISQEDGMSNPSSDPLYVYHSVWDKRRPLSGAAVNSHIL